MYCILTGGGNKEGTFSSAPSTTGLKLQKPRTNYSLGEHSGQLTAFLVLAVSVRHNGGV